MTFRWEMTPAAGGPVAASGRMFMLLDGEGRISRLYQFADPQPVLADPQPVPASPPPARAPRHRDRPVGRAGRAQRP